MGGVDQLLTRIGDLLKGAPGPLIGAGLGLAAFVWIRLSKLPVDLTNADTLTQSAALGACLTLGIGAGSVCQRAAIASLRSVVWIRGLVERRRQRKRFKLRLANLTPIERRIIARLIADGSRSFDTDATGGHASGFIAEGFFHIGGAPTQAAHVMRVPVVVPDIYWEVMMSMRPQFEADIAALQPGTLPWRRNWAAH